MKIAFPTQEDRGLASVVYGHFGSAPWFVLVDSEQQAPAVIKNTDQHHTHGQCQPLKALDGHPVDAVVVGGIGGGALQKLKAAGVKVYRAVDGSVDENMQLIQSGRLPEFSMLQTCIGHGPDGNCAH